MTSQLDSYPYFLCLFSHALFLKVLKRPAGCVLSMWEKIMITLWNLWLHMDLDVWKKCRLTHLCIGHRRVQQSHTDIKSTLVQLMAWCRQAARHYLIQCCTRSIPPYYVSRLQWANVFPGSARCFFARTTWVSMHIRVTFIDFAHRVKIGFRGVYFISIESQARTRARVQTQIVNTHI